MKRDIKVAITRPVTRTQGASAKSAKTLTLLVFADLADET